MTEQQYQSVISTLAARIANLEVALAVELAKATTEAETSE